MTDRNLIITVDSTSQQESDETTPPPCGRVGSQRGEINPSLFGSPARASRSQWTALTPQPSSPPTTLSFPLHPLAPLIAPSHPPPTLLPIPPNPPTPPSRWDPSSSTYPTSRLPADPIRHCPRSGATWRHSRGVTCVLLPSPPEAADEEHGRTARCTRAATAATGSSGTA